MEWNHFTTILLLDPYFKIKGWIYRGILGVLIKKSLNLISFLPIPRNFRGNENLRFWGFAWEFIREWNGIELNGIIIRECKVMEWNGIYLSKGKEWKRMEWNGIK